jgi:hypothetical protein
MIHVLTLNERILNVAKKQHCSMEYSLLKYGQAVGKIIIYTEDVAIKGLQLFTCATNALHI